MSIGLNQQSQVNGPSHNPEITGLSRLRGKIMPWHIYLIVSIGFIFAYFQLRGTAQAIGWEIFGASSSAVMLIGIHIHRPNGARFWRLIALGLGMLVIADVVLNIYENVLGSDQPFPSIADGFFLGGNFIIIASLAWMVQRRAPSGDHGSFIDAAIVMIGAGVLSWTFLMVPYAKDPTLTFVQKLISISYPLIDVLLLACLARLFFVGAARSASLYLLSGAVVATLVADVVYAELVLRGQYQRGNLIDAFWLAWYALWGVAALHPSMKTLLDRAHDRPQPLTQRRLILLTVAALLVPAVGLVQWARNSPVDAPVIAGFSGLLFLLVLVRMNGLVRGLETARKTLEAAVHREQTLRELSAALSNASDRSGIYEAALGAADALARGDAHGWIATGDSEEMRVVAGKRRQSTSETVTFEGLSPDVIGALNSRQVAIIENSASPSIWRSLGQRAPSSLVLAAPLFVQQEFAGLIVVTIESQPESGLLDGLSTMASQVALALERSMLAEDLFLRKSEERFGSLVRNASDLIFVIRFDGTVNYVSPSVERVVGFQSDQLIGSNVRTLFAAEEADRVASFQDELASTAGISTPIELHMLHRDGKTRIVEAVGNNLLDDPSVNGIVINARDITERKAAEEQLAHQAFHDPLTGLPNRARFLDRLEHALARSARRLERVAILFIDFDRFKVINDSLGHEVGDLFLIEAGQRLARSVRPADTVARLGGDEFTILLEDILDAEQANAAAERILAQFELPVVVGGREIFTSLSMGIALSRNWQNRPSDLLREADIAMYQIKRKGGNGFAIFDAEMGMEAMKRLELEVDLRRAIDHDELRVYYQPEVDLMTNQIMCMEALVRWQHPERGLVSPRGFIPLAEETGLVIPLGRWVLTEACRQAVIWHDIYGDSAPTISVNLSVRQIQHHGIVEEVADVLRLTGLDPARLALEITETVFLEDAEANHGVLRQLKELGVLLAMDDFGSGFSNFAQLGRYSMDILKIDRTVVAGFGQNPERTGVLRAISSLADELDMKVVAEGVETSAQVNQLKLLGCSLAQGYFFAMPMAGDEADDMLRQRIRGDEDEQLLEESA